MIFETMSDNEWFKANLNPTAHGLPELPAEHIQKQFTGKAGKSNLEQAFAFYQFIRSRYLLNSTKPSAETKVMDFGAGWGRIARLFLRDINSHNLVAVDPMAQAVALMQETKLPCRIVHSQQLPPLPEVQTEQFDLIYAYSVFSHLSEVAFRAWMPHLLSLLVPGGVLVFTTRGREFLNYIERKKIRPEIYGDYAAIRKKLDEDNLLFFRNRSDDDVTLSGNLFGQAFVTRPYIEKYYGDVGVIEFAEMVPQIDQLIVSIRKS